MTMQWQQPDEVVLDNKDGAVKMVDDPPLHELGSYDALLAVERRGRLVDRGKQAPLRPHGMCVTVGRNDSVIGVDNFPLHFRLVGAHREVRRLDGAAASSFVQGLSRVSFGLLSSRVFC